MLGMPMASRGLIVTLPLTGYGVGLLMVVPLGDLLENRRLVVLLVALESTCLLLLGAASHSRPVTFLSLAFLVGLTASAVQVIMPYASQVTGEQMRGRARGRLVSGVMFGIMLARPLASFVAGRASWRAIYFLAGGLMASLAIALAVTIPSRRPAAGATYGALLQSMGESSSARRSCDAALSTTRRCSERSACSGRRFPVGRSC
jgi:MFS family permease